MRLLLVHPRPPVRVPKALIIVQNLSVPTDRRVWLECQALIRAGWGVTVICPRGAGEPAHRELDGVFCIAGLLRIAGRERRASSQDEDSAACIKQMRGFFSRFAGSE